MLLQKYTQKLVRASLLGLAALTINSVAVLLLGFDLKIHVGNVLIFVSALSLGAWGGLVSVMTGVFPFSLYIDAPGELLRLMALVIVVGALAKRSNKINGTSLVLISWLLFVSPITKAVLDKDHLISLSLNDIWLVWSDLLAVTVAEIFLFSSNVWCRITDRPRHIPLDALTIQTLLAITLVALCLGYSWSNPMWMTSEILILWLTATSAVVIGGGYYITKYLINNFHSLARDTLGKKDDTSTFSGLSSEHWRRKEKTDRRHSSKGIWRRPQQLAQAATGTTFKVESHVGDGVCVIDVRGTIYFANRPFVELTGIKVENFIGKRIDSVGINESWYKPLLAIAEETLAKGPRVQELKFNSLPNKLRYYEVSTRVASPATDMLSSGEPDSVIVSVKDISERRTIESGVLKAQRLESIGALMNGLAHEFNNSLTTITAKASIAASDSVKPESAQKALKDILEFARSAAQTVQGLLDFTDGSMGTLEKVDLSKLVNDRLTILRKLVGANYDLTFTSSAEPIGSLCNPVLLGQALTNLILQARESYSEGSGEISIRLDTEQIEEAVSELPLGVKPGTFSRLRVHHSGVVMNRDVIARVFDPSSSARGDGSSLRLSIVFTIVRAHDGFLTAESHPGKGTTISVYLPLVELIGAEEVEKPLPGPIVSEEDAVQPNGQKILVVEDEPNVRELTAFMLSELGYKVVSCDNGKDAIEIAEKEPFDLVLVDYVIPRLGGNDLLDKLKALNSDCKTLVMTGYGSSVADDVKSAIIQKPFDMDTLALAIRRALTEDPKIAPVHHHHQSP